MNNFDWADRFKEIYDQAKTTYAAGKRRPAEMADAAGKSFLESIGCSLQELFDLVEDDVRDQAPGFNNALLITAARRDYFLYVQKGKPSGRRMSSADLPVKVAKLGGIEWLPRIIVKARAKLRGELPNDTMYGCGGDRPFLKSVNIHLADFLREVWAAGDDDDKILKFVQTQRDAAGK